MIPGMLRNYSNNAIGNENPSVMFWIKDMTPNPFIVRSEKDLHSDSIIPLRSWNADFVGGTYRQEMALKFDKVRYGRRQLVETRFSVLKKRFGGDLKARIFLVQMKEISGKMIVCNIHRFLQFLVIEVFYTAKKSLFWLTKSGNSSPKFSSD